MLDVDEGYVAVLHNWRQIALVLLLEQKLHEAFDHVHFNIAAIVSGYQDLSLTTKK